MNWEYLQPVVIRFGNGIRKELKEAAASLGCENGLLVSDPFFVQSGLAEQLVAESGGTLTGIYGKISPNPDVTEVDACAKVIKENRHGFLAALGGGSALDCAKAAGSICLTDDSIRKYHGTGLAMPAEHLPLIAIPTTAGTGSEVTCVSVLTDHENGKKSPIVSNGFYPSVAVIDPELTCSMPPKVTASTGIDVLCHALEGFWSKGHQPICDALALHASKLVFTYLKRAYHDGTDSEAREKMAEASVIAGLAKELGFSSADALADEIHSLKEELGLRNDLKDLHLTKEQIAELVRISRHPNLYNNPVEITDEMLSEMYHKMA